MGILRAFGAVTPPLPLLISGWLSTAVCNVFKIVIIQLPLLTVPKVPDVSLEGVWGLSRRFLEGARGVCEGFHSSSRTTPSRASTPSSSLYLSLYIGMVGN